LTREVLDREEGTEQGTHLIPELERSSVALDKCILKWQNSAEKVNEHVINVEQKLTDMENMIIADESGIELLTQQSIILASQLRKIEPAFEFIRKVKGSITDVKRENANIRFSLEEAGKKIENMKSSKEHFELHNGELREKASSSVAK